MLRRLKSLARTLGPHILRHLMERKGKGHRGGHGGSRGAGGRRGPGRRRP